MIMTKSKRDWKLFCEKIKDWQESYMGKLLKEYDVYLNSDLDASEKFWTLHKRILQDCKKPGVRLQLGKADMEFDIARLIHDGVITMDDLSEFSEDTREAVLLYLNR